MPRVYAVHKRPPRARVLAAAEKLLRSRGVDAITTRKVAADAGMTAMAIYRHFQNKDALLDALVQSGFERWEERLAKAVKPASGASPQAADPLVQIENALRAYRDFALAEPRYFDVMFATPRRRTPIAPASLSATTSPSFAVLIDAVRQGVATGAFIAGDPAQIILMVWAAAHGLLALHVSGRFGFNDRVFRGQYDRTMKLLLSALLARPLPSR